jgi:hypothetical protein
MDETHKIFFEDLARHLDYWVDETTKVATQAEADLFAWNDCEGSLRRLQQVLVSPEDKSAFRAVLFAGMSGLLHSVMTGLDGATQMADEFTVDVITSEGKTLGPGLDELLVEHLYSTGRMRTDDARSP